VLDLAKIEAGKLTLENIEFDLADIVRGVHAAFIPFAKKKGLSCTLANEAKGVFRGDPVRVRQILYNLISNAVKFTEQGEIRICAMPLSDRGVEIVVQDTGIGIPSEAMAMLFDKFHQGDASTTRRFGGTGLGLAVCHEIITLMGGKIRVESEVGIGTRVTVTLPLAQLRATAIQTQAQSLPPVATASAKLKILAAEDNTMNQLVLRSLLQRMGLEPVIVANGKHALEAWQEASWDIVLMDVQMPQMDGPAATREIRRREARTGRKRTPIIALTANAMAHQIESYIEAGMDGYVSKPIDFQKLSNALWDLLHEQQPRLVAGITNRERPLGATPL